MCWCGSVAEQLIRNQQVVGSNPTTSSMNLNPQNCKGSEDFLICNASLNLISLSNMREPKSLPNRIQIADKGYFCYNYYNCEASDDFTSIEFGDFIV
jgi:hypothetical protein